MVRKLASGTGIHSDSSVLNGSETIARAFLEEGASVTLMARNPEKGAVAVAALDAGDRARFVAGDAMVQADVEGFVDATVEAYGTVDELNCVLGLIAEACRGEDRMGELRQMVLGIQNELFDLGSQLAVLAEDRREGTPVIVESDMVFKSCNVFNVEGLLHLNRQSIDFE